MKEFFLNHINSHNSHAIIGGTLFGTILGVEMHTIFNTVICAVIAAVTSYVTSKAIAWIVECVNKTKK